MSLGISLTLPDGVLVVADGRTSNIGGERTVTSDDANKILPLGADLFCVVFGIVMSTDLALKFLEREVTNVDTAEELDRLANLALDFGWGHLTAQNLDFSLDVRPRVRAGLLIAGITPSGDFFHAGTLRGLGIQPSRTFSPNEPYVRLVFGGEEHNAEQMFTRKVREIIETCRWTPDGEIRNQMVHRILSAARQVIRRVGREDPSVGGTIRYALSRKGKGSEVGSL